MIKKLDELKARINLINVSIDNAEVRIRKNETMHGKRYSVNHTWYEKTEKYLLAIHTFRFIDEKRYIVDIGFYEKKSIIDTEELNTKVYIASTYNEAVNIIESTIRAFTII